MRFPFTNRSRGFTLVEVLIVVVVIGILAAMTINYYSGARETAYLTRSKAELESIANAARLYANKNGSYPADTSRNIPAEIKDFIAKNDQGSNWPSAPWPGSVYDWDAWDINTADDDNTLPTTDPINLDTYQISIRFCDAGAPSTCKFPKQPWVTGFGVDSAFYYCIKGYCRSHRDEPVTYPGYCYNCFDHQAVKKPGE